MDRDKDSKDKLNSVNDLLKEMDSQSQSKDWLDAALDDPSKGLFSFSDDSKGSFSEKLSEIASEKGDSFFLDDGFSFFENTMRKNAEEIKREKNDQAERVGHPRITHIMNDESLNADPRESSSLGLSITEKDPAKPDADRVHDGFDKCLFAALNESESSSAEGRKDPASNSYLRLGQLVSPVSEGVRIAPSVLPARSQGKTSGSNRRITRDNPILADDLASSDNENLPLLSSVESCLVDDNNEALNCSGTFSILSSEDVENAEKANDKQEASSAEGAVPEAQADNKTPENKSPDAAKSDEKSSDAAKSDEKSSDAAKSDEKSSDAAKSDEKSSDAAKSDDKSADVVTPESKKSEAPKSDDKKVSDSADSDSKPIEKKDDAKAGAGNVQATEIKPEEHRRPFSLNLKRTARTPSAILPVKKGVSAEPKNDVVSNRKPGLATALKRDRGAAKSVLNDKGTSGATPEKATATKIASTPEASAPAPASEVTAKAVSPVVSETPASVSTPVTAPEASTAAAAPAPMDKPLSDASAIPASPSEESGQASSLGVSKLDKSKESEIYASRFFNEDGHVSTLGFARKHFDDEATKKALKLLHPDDRFSIPSPEDDLKQVRFSTINYVYDHLFIHENRAIMGRIPTCIGRITELERMMQKIFEASTVLHPKLIEVTADNRFEIEMFIESILERCKQRSENVTFYATCDREVCDSPVSCFRSLIASRIGYSPDAKVKTERIIRSAVEIVDACDKTWAQNILFSAFGLDEFVIKNGDATEQSIDLRLLELFLKGVQHDAECGPVVVLLTHADKYRFDGWREAIAQLRRLKAPSITVIVCGDSTADVEGIERLELGLLPDVAIQYYVTEIFRREEPLPQGFVETMVAKSMGSYTRLWNIIKILELRGIVKQQEGGVWIHPEAAFVIKAVSNDMDALMNEHFSSLSEDQRYLYSVAAILNAPFRIDDMSLVLSIDSLEGEIPWFRSLRSEWTERVVKELVDLGEIQRIDDEEHGVRYVLSDIGNAARLVPSMEETYVHAVHGCYAQLLQLHNDTDPQVYYHFEQAGMWGDAAQGWLQLEEKRRMDYYNLTSLALLNNCLTYMAPQYGAIFVALQRELGCLAMRFGVYDTAYEHYCVMLRVAQLIQDPLQGVEAFIGIASCLLLLGSYSDAREMMSYGIKLAEQFNQRSLIARCYHQLAEITFRTGGRGTLSGAMRYVDRAIEIWRELGDLTQLAKTLALNAEIFMVRGDLARTRATLSEAYYALKNSGMWFETPPVLAAFAELCIHEKKYRDAANYLAEGMDIVQKTDNVAHRFDLLYRRAELNIATTNREAVREDLALMTGICEQHPCTPWIVRIRLLTAQFDFSRNSFQKATRAIKSFFDMASPLKNSFLMGLGYSLSAKLNFEVFKRQLGRVSLEKTDKLFSSATTIFESIGAWHIVAENLRSHAEFLDMTGREADAKRSRDRAEKVDPFCQ